MRRNYPYLRDTAFLNRIYGQHNKTIYCNIISLDWDERPLQEIQGKIISGSISCNGDSIIRRTANLSINIKDNSELYNNVDSLFTINKKIFLETGLSNGLMHLGQENYPDYPIIWFPFGVFIITNCSINHDSTGVTVSLNLSDKMALLNGDAGGIIPASTNFESVDTLGPDGDLHTEYLPINRIIPEMVNHFGGEDLNRIIVSDVPNRIKQVLKWHGGSPLYLWLEKGNIKNCFYTSTLSDLTENYYKKAILYDYDAGYTYTPFTYPGELAANAGDSVCTVLNKIKERLGNYEYYYDVFGNFIFQEIKNYVNTTQWRTLVQNNSYGDNDVYLPYVINPVAHSAVYSFENSDFVISYNNSPQFNMVKNDFVVWGKRKSMNGTELACRYHLAIDDRPKLDKPMTLGFGICFDTDIKEKVKKCHPIHGYVGRMEDLPTPGIVGNYYAVVTRDANENVIAYKIATWVTDTDAYNKAITATEEVTYKPSENPQAGYVILPNAVYYGAGTFHIQPTSNWRNILYFKGIIGSVNGTDTGYYWAELCNEWPKLYDVEYDCWNTDKISKPTDLDWWLDIIDNNSTLNSFSVKAIGRRSYAKVESECNCVFEPDIPDIVMVDLGSAESEIPDYRSQMTRQELMQLGLIPCQVDPVIYDNLVPGGTYNSCYQNVRQLITNYTNYNESISVNCLPIYHLEPNTRVAFNDPESGIYGDYIISSISFNLGNGGTMSLNAKKVIEKI